MRSDILALRYFLIILRRNVSQIGASFLSHNHSLIASLFSSYFSFTPSFFLSSLSLSLSLLLTLSSTFLRFLSVSCSYFSPFQNVIHEASFILLWSCFLRIALLQFAWALNVIRVKWDRCILFEKLAYAAISHDFTARGPFDRKIENSRWKKIRENWTAGKRCVSFKLL